MDWFLYDRNLCHGSLNRSLPTTKWGLILSDPSPLLTFIDGYKIYYLEVTNYTIYLANLFFQSKLSLLSHLTPLPVRAYLILIYPIPSSLKKLIFSILQKTNPPTTFVFDKERKRLVLKQRTLFTCLLYLMRTGTNSNSNITQTFHISITFEYFVPFTQFGRDLDFHWFSFIFLQAIST